MTVNWSKFGCMHLTYRIRHLTLDLHAQFWHAKRMQTVSVISLCMICMHAFVPNC